MAEFVAVPGASDLQDGQVMAGTIGGRDIIVARVGGTYFAADRWCPHMGGDLSRGSLEGTVITCPRHGSQFDLADARVIRWTDFTGAKLAVGKLLKSPRPPKIHEVKLEDGKVLVALREG